MGSAYLSATGFVCPRLSDTSALLAHLGGAPYREADGWAPAPTTLPPRQARRLSAPTKLAIQAAEQIAGHLPEDAAWIFASSAGEGVILNDILRALSSEPVLIQPVKFQNAVHNAAQGQWSIAAGLKGAATSIAAYDHTVGAAFLKAMVQLAAEGRAVGVVIYDLPLPEPLHDKRPFGMPIAASFALHPSSATGFSRIEIEASKETPGTDLSLLPVDTPLVGSNNPVRFVLPLFERLRTGDPRPVVLSTSDTASVRISLGTDT